MRLLKYPKDLIIGKNNYIESGVKLMKNVIIGDNNKIYDGTVIYPNTKIGNNNIILNNNILGEHPIESNEKFNKKIFNGLEIGNNNFLHINNIIYNGYYRKTLIHNNNKILGESHIGHDVHIYNNVNIYTRGMICGLVDMLDYSGIGVYSAIHQRVKIGQYSFVGMNNTITKNVFPFFININNKHLKLNNHLLDKNYNYKLDTNILNEIVNNFEKNNLVLKNYEDLIDKNTYDIIYKFLSHK